MKPQRRFTKRFEIEAEINKLKLKAKRKLKDADNFEATASVAIVDSRVLGISAGDRQFHIEHADHWRKNAIRSRRSAEIINDVKLPALKRTLAAFQTETLFKGDDQAVVMQK